MEEWLHIYQDSSARLCGYKHHIVKARLYSPIQAACTVLEETVPALL